MIGSSFFQHNFVVLARGCIFHRSQKSIDCNMLNPDIERYQYSVKRLCPILTRPIASYIDFDITVSVEEEDLILLIGGRDEIEMKVVSVAETEIYSVEKDSWTKGPRLNKARHYCAALCLGGYTYVLFGYNKHMKSGATQEHLNSIERMKNETRHSWQYIRPSYQHAVPRGAQIAFVKNGDEVMVNGILITGQHVNETFRIDLERGTFRSTGVKQSKYKVHFNAVRFSDF